MPVLRTEKGIVNPLFACEVSRWPLHPVVTKIHHASHLFGDPCPFCLCALNRERLMNLEGSLTKSRGLKGDTKLLESVLFPKSTIPPIDGPQGSTLDGTRDRFAGKQSAGETSNSTRRKSSSAGGRQHRYLSCSTCNCCADCSVLERR